jgi:hypothetical protein
MAAPGCDEVVSLYGLWSHVESLSVLAIVSRVLNSTRIVDLCRCHKLVCFTMQYCLTLQSFRFRTSTTTLKLAEKVYTEINPLDELPPAIDMIRDLILLCRFFVFFFPRKVCRRWYAYCRKSCKERPLTLVVSVVLITSFSRPDRINNSSSYYRHGLWEVWSIYSRLFVALSSPQQASKQRVRASQGFFDELLYEPDSLSLLTDQECRYNRTP